MCHVDCNAVADGLTHDFILVREGVAIKSYSSIVMLFYIYIYHYIFIQ